jgi:hypothetical protein
MTDELLERVRQMGEVGFNASERESLPLLFKEVFKVPLCSSCKRDGFNTLMNWYRKKTIKPNNYMAFTIKEDYREVKKGEPRNFIFMQSGRRIVVNYLNLNEEKAHLMLASKYAHVIEGTPEKLEESFRGSLKGIVKEADPNSQDASVSTSKGASKGVTVSKKGGKKKLSLSGS